MRRSGTRHDFRLVPVAVASWIATALATSWNVHSGVVLAVIASTVTLLAATGRRWTLCTAALGTAAGATSAALHVHGITTGPLVDLARRQARVVADVRLVRDPTMHDGAHGWSFITVDATAVRVGDQPLRAPVLVLAHGGSWLSLLPGQRVRIEAATRLPRPGDTVAAVLVARGPPTPIGRPPLWQRAAGHVREGLRRATASLPPDERGLVPGLVVGDVSQMPDALTKAFRVTGLTHLNAVSGENVAVVLAAVASLARFAGTSRRTRSLVSGVALLAFVVLVRPSPSVLRAATMGALTVVATVVGRRGSALPVLAASVTGLVVVDPFLARTPGFALSVCATAAIVVAAPAVVARLERRWPRPLAIAIAVPFVAQLACTPVLVWVFGQLSPVAIPANVVAAPAVPPATIIGVACAITAVVAPPLAGAVAWLAAIPAGWLALVARTFAAIPGAGLTVPGAWRGEAIVFGLAAAAGLLAALVREVRRRRHERAAGRGILATCRE